MYTAYKSYESLTKSYLYLISNEKKFYSHLKALLISIFEDRFINTDPRGFDIRTKKGKDLLMDTAEQFLKAKVINKASLVERGWSNELINKYLSQPHLKETTNPFGRTLILELYSLIKVEQLEQLPDVKSKLTTNSLKFRIDKIVAIDKWVESLDIDLKLLSLENLLTLTIEDTNSFLRLKNLPTLSKSSTAVKLETACINYIRHKCSNYDLYLKGLCCVQNGDIAHEKLKQSVNKQINIMYPNLKNQIYKYQIETQCIVKQKSLR